MQKNLIKFGAGILGLVIVGGAVWYGVLSYQRKNSPEYAMMREYEKLTEAYKNDTYGGDTPEETLRLFIDALKAGDTDLAAKYFVVDKQEAEKKYLEEVKKDGLIESMVGDLSSAQLALEDEKAFFTLVENKRAIAQLVMYKINNRWKISEL